MCLYVRGVCSLSLLRVAGAGRAGRAGCCMRNSEVNFRISTKWGDRRQKTERGRRQTTKILGAGAGLSLSRCSSCSLLGDEMMLDDGEFGIRRVGEGSSQRSEEVDSQLSQSRQEVVREYSDSESCQELQCRLFVRRQW